MKLPRLKTILLIPLFLFAIFYAVGAIVVAQRDMAAVTTINVPSAPLNIAIFGASGTAGDGILKAALAADEIGTIHVFTRRDTPRILQGVAAGKVQKTNHMDYLDYSVIQDQIATIDTVYWAIGISSLGVDEKTYGLIHVDFPMQFIKAWNEVNKNVARSFHFVSSSDISDKSTTMWVREKIRAEKSLFGLAEGTGLSVIAYRPDYIGPTREQESMGQQILYWFFKPVGAAVRATQIGQAMMAVSLSGDALGNGSKLPTSQIIRYSDALENASASTPTH